MGFRSIRRLLWQKDGSVSIFAVIVLSSLLLFFSVLIDFARIAALHHMAENGSKSAIRSVLSAYDSQLYGLYGLFGRGGTEGRQIFATVLEENISGNARGSSEGFNLVASRLDTAELHTSSVLGDHRIFARQVLEEMKYKAPIDFTIELASKFVPMAVAMKEAHVTIELLDQMRQLYDKRESHVERAMKLQSQAAEAAKNGSYQGLLPIPTLSGVSQSAESLITELEQYFAHVNHDETRDIGMEPVYTAEIADYEERVISMANRLGNDNEDLLERHDALLQEAMNELEAAGQINEQMKSARQRAEADDSQLEGYERVAGSNLPESENDLEPNHAAEQLEQVKQSSDLLIWDDRWFADFRQEISEQMNAYRTFDAVMSALLSTMRFALIGSIQQAEQIALLERQLMAIRQAYGRYREHYIDPAVILEQRKADMPDQPITAQLKQQEAEAESSWKEATQWIKRLKDGSPQEEHQLLFDQARQRYEANLLYNQHRGDLEEGASLSVLGGDAHGELKQASKQMSHLFTGVADMLERVRDTLYYGEYTIHRFTVFDPQQLRGMVEHASADMGSLPVSFHDQEAEYVLYGLHHPLGNIAAMFGELFAVRIAIRTMEGLIESRSLGHPLLILSAALIYSIEKTMEDLFSFVNQGSAPLSKYVNVELSYKDYLRLFMLMHSGNESSRLARMVAVIEQNRGITLGEVPTGITGEARISLKLWFVPGVMKVLGRFGLLQGKVVGNHYETTLAAGSSY